MHETRDNLPEPTVGAALQPASAADFIVGRQDVLLQIRQAAAGLTILVGDSGIGKTKVLLSAAAETSNSQIGEFNGSAGSLQRTLLDLLATTLQAWQSAQPTPQRLLDGARRLAERATNATVSQFGRLTAKVMLSYLGTKIGPEMAETIKEVVAEVTGPDDHLLEQRIKTAKNDDALDAIVAMSSELHEFVGDIAFFIDNGERLTDDDFSALTDLGRRLPTGVRIVTAVALADKSDTARTRRASTVGGADVITIRELDEQDVAAWLARAGLRQADVATIRRLTGGYPVFVETCVELLSSGRDLSKIEVSRSFASMTEQSWSDLGEGAQRAAQLLLAFPEAPPVELICEITGLDGPGWFVVERQLSDSRIFCATGSGRRWFHDRRREILWNSLIDSDQRRWISEWNLKVISRFAQATGEWPPEILVPLAQMVPLAPEFSSTYEGTAEIADLSRQDLATLFAVYELLEPDGKGPAVIETGSLLSFRRGAFPDLRDARQSVERLVDKGLLFVVSNNESSVATMVLKSAVAEASLLGRWQIEFGRMPLARAASVIFAELRHLIGPFETGIAGIGRPTFSDQASGFSNGSPLLFVQARVSWRNFYAIVLFRSDVDRDSARDRLLAQPVTVLGEQVQLAFVHAHPSAPIPSRRFLTAMGEVYELPHGLLNRPPRLKPPGLPGLESARQRLATIAWLRSRLNQTEQIAGGIDQELAFFIDETQDHSIEVAIRTSAPRAVEASIPMELLNRPMSFFLLEEHLAVEPDESITSVTVRSGNVYEDPTIAQLLRVASATKRFNGQRLRYFLPSDEDRLARDLDTAFEQRRQDIGSLEQAAIKPNVPRLKEPRRRNIIWVHRESQQATDVGHLVTTLLIPSLETSLEINFGAPPFEVRGSTTHEGISNWLKKTGICSDETVDWAWSYGDARFELAKLLGYDHNEIEVLPDSYKQFFTTTSAPQSIQQEAG